MMLIPVRIEERHGLESHDASLRRQFILVKICKDSSMFQFLRQKVYLGGEDGGRGVSAISLAS